MGFEWLGGGGVGDGRGAGSKLVAIYEHVLIGCAAAFGSDNMCVVWKGDFVDNADKAFGPVRVVVFLFLRLA